MLINMMIIYTNNTSHLIDFNFLKFCVRAFRNGAIHWRLAILITNICLWIICIFSIENVKYYIGS